MSRSHKPEEKSAYEKFLDLQQLGTGARIVGGVDLDNVRLDEDLGKDALKKIAKAQGVKKSELPETMSLEELIDAGVKPRDFTRKATRGLLDTGYASSRKTFAAPEKIEQLRTAFGLSEQVEDFRIKGTERALADIAFDPFSPEGREDPRAKTIIGLTEESIRSGQAARGGVRLGTDPIMETFAVQSGLMNLDAALHNQGLAELQLVAPQLIPEIGLSQIDLAYNQQLFNFLQGKSERANDRATALLFGDRAMLRSALYERIPGGGGGGGGGLLGLIGGGGGGGGGG